MDKEFVENIEIELQNLERLIEEMDQIINKAKEEPDFIFIRAAGSIIHDFYCGVEKYLKRLLITSIISYHMEKIGMQNFFYKWHKLKAEEMLLLTRNFCRS